MTKVRSKTHQDGYALVLVVFLGAVLLISALAIAPNILTQGRREQEREMIWRGGQYVRAISLYRRKTGHFPASLEDLSKGLPGVHFLRKQYKDPFNKGDGSWRLIYLGPGGQLVGSLNSRGTTIPFPLGPAAPVATTPGSPSSSSNAFGQVSSFTTGQNQAAAPAAANAAPVPPAELPPGNVADTSPIMGGAIVGVGSKIDHNSIITFNKAHNYRLFEFIWDATKELNLSGLPGVPGAPTKDPNFQLPPSPADPKPILPVQGPTEP